MYWWAIDMSANGDVRATAFVVGLSGNVTYDQMERYTWDELTQYTWDRPGQEDSSTDTVETINTPRPLRTLLKLDYGLRFRRIYFEVYLDCDGTPATAPVQIFSITPMIGVKAKMTNGVS
jgi:phage tail sheath gpL-like